MVDKESLEKVLKDYSEGLRKSGKVLKSIIDWSGGLGRTRYANKYFKAGLAILGGVTESAYGIIWANNLIYSSLIESIGLYGLAIIPAVAFGRLTHTLYEHYKLEKSLK